MRIADVMHNPDTLRLISNRNKMLKPLTLKFLFDRLHVSNVYYDAPFNEGHLATRSKRCAAEKKPVNHVKLIHLKSNLPDSVTHPSSLMTWDEASTSSSHQALITSPSCPTRVRSLKYEVINVFKKCFCQT